LPQEGNRTQEDKSRVVEREKTHFSPLVSIKAPSHQVSRLYSLEDSPHSEEKQPNLTTREMELPLKEAEEKGTSTHLPTTSRSPKPIREHPFHPIEEIPELTTSNNGKRVT
jgi:hypothetical protein